MSWWMWLVTGWGVAYVVGGLLLLKWSRDARLAKEREAAMAQYDDLVPWWGP